MREIEIRNRKGEVFIVKVDDEDFDRLMKHKWSIAKFKRGPAYAVRRVEGRLRFMHHEVIGKPPKGMLTDHKNRDSLDNQKHNLWHCTPSQNQKNKNPYMRLGKLIQP